MNFVREVNFRSLWRFCCGHPCYNGLEGACSPTGGEIRGARVDWFVARNGKVVGPLTFEAVADAARRGELGGNDRVWEPDADRWRPADEVPALWTALEPTPFWATWGRRATWLRAAAGALIVSGSALLVSLTILASTATEAPRPLKRDCALADYLQGKCR
jgi:hypothetical protein